jgi:VWFA-related protein
VIDGALALAVLALLQAAEHPPTIPVEAEIVRVDALVKDKKGRPVPGLSVGDFVVYEDNRPVSIVAFEDPSTAVPPSPEAPEESGAAARSVPPGQTFTIVVYIDNRNLTSAGRRRVLEGLEPALEAQLATGHARVLVLAEQRGTRALGAVTSDPAKLRVALAAAANGVAQGNLDHFEERTTLDLVRETITAAEQAGLGAESCAEILPQLQGIVRQYADARALHHRETFARLAGVIAAVDALPGTKALLFLTENVEQVPGLSLFHQLGDICPQAMQSHSSELYAAEQEFDLSRAFQKVAARANAARVTIYPVDGGGLTTNSIADVSQQGDRRYTPTPNNDRVRAANVKAGPGILAEETGGVAVFDSNRPSVTLESIADDVRGRYSLGFSPAHAPEGRRHSLRVEVGRKGLAVRHRLSYFHAPSGETQVKRTYAALLLGYEEDGLGATIEAEVAGETTQSPSPEVAIRVSLPLSRIGSRPAGDHRIAQVRVTMVIRKAGETATEGRAVGRETTVALHLPAASPEGETARHDFVVRIPAAGEDQEIAVGVRDLVGGAATYKRLVVHR